MSKSKSDQTKKPVVRETVPEGWLKQIIEADEAHTEEVLASRVEYPDPEDYVDLDAPALEKLGFAEKVDFDPEEIEMLYGRGSSRKRRNRRRKKDRRNKSGSKNRSGGGHGGRKLPNPKAVAAEVRAIMGNIKQVDNSGNLVFSSWNMEFLDASKARFFLETYEIVVPQNHLIACSEITQAGLDVIANAVGYKAYASVENNRNQAVGFLVHPRLRVIGSPVSYDEVGTVQGIPNLRPAFRLNLEDTVTGDKFCAIVVHLKSMRGGPKKTGPVRRQQCHKLAEALKHDDDAVFIGGDWNTFLDNTTDTDPLENEGFTLVNPKDTTPTQSMGSRLDGFYKRDTGSPVGRLRVFNLWQNTKITRALSDHGVVRIHWRVCTAGVGNDPTCGTVPSSGGPFSVEGDGKSEVDVSN